MLSDHDRELVPRPSVQQTPAGLRAGASNLFEEHLDPLFDTPIPQVANPVQVQIPEAADGRSWRRRSGGWLWLPVG
jgi:hypothetical protein